MMKMKMEEKIEKKGQGIQHKVHVQKIFEGEGITEYVQLLETEIQLTVQNCRTIR